MNDKVTDRKSIIVRCVPSLFRGLSMVNFNDGNKIKNSSGIFESGGNITYPQDESSDNRRLIMNLLHRYGVSEGN